MAEVQVTVNDDGGAYVQLASSGEVRHSVALEALEEADMVPALQALVLDFDHYGRLVGIEVTDAAASVLPPALLDAPGRG
jgi:uncharacterized protein YuzE